MLSKPPSPLTAREEQVALLAAAELSDKEIAARLQLSVRTIHAHLRSIYAKLGIASRQELHGRFDARPQPRFKTPD